MEIKRGNTVLADVFLKENSYVEEEVMSTHTLTLNFLSRNVVDLQINDYVVFDGNTYKIRHNEKVAKRETSLGYEYNVTFYSSRYDLQDVEFFLHGKPERKKNFDYYTGTARQWLDLMVTNMNRTGLGWVAGSCIESRMITLSFKDKKVGSVLDEVVKELDTEYWVSGKTVSIGKREYASNGLVLGQGEGMGFNELEVSAVDDTPPITVLYPYGSDKNLSTDYGSDYLLLPGGQLSIEKNVDKYGRIEKSVQFDHIFPQGEFTVTERIDTTTLKASGIDFNLTDCLLDGVEVVVTFQDGGLAGYDLAIVEGSWDNAKKQFKLKVNEQENALKVPGDINFSVGDKFILTGLKMPQSYINNASNQLLDEATTYLEEHCEKRVQLRGKCDEVVFRQQNLFVSCGQMVGVYSEQLKIDREIRVTRVKRYIENGKPSYRYDLTLSDFLQGNGFKDLVDDVEKLPGEIEDSVRPVREWSKRSWGDVMQTLKMMFDPEGDYFTELITPLAVHTAQLIVGTNSQQMDLVGVKFIPNADNDANYFKNTAGKLVHFTVAETVKEWSIPAASFRLNNSLAYYVYAKCSKTTSNGSMLVTERKIKLEEEAGYYHFWVGVLNTPEDGVRSWNPNYGYTEIAGQTITTGVIKDKLSRLVIDLMNGTITGPITFKSGSSGYNNIADKPNLQPIYNGISDALTEAENASNAANSAAGSANSAIDIANSKARVFYSTYTPSGARTNDLWVDGTNIYRYNGSSWVYASVYDNTQTKINGGLVTTGAVAVGPSGNPNGGISGSGTVRIWAGGRAGANGAPPSTPVFRVFDTGSVESRGSIWIANSNGSKLAGFSGDGTDPSSIRIWAGNANPANAPFRVTQGGSVSMAGFMFSNSKMQCTSNNGYTDEYTLALNSEDGSIGVSGSASAAYFLSPHKAYTDTEGYTSYACLYARKQVIRTKTPGINYMDAIKIRQFGMCSAMDSFINLEWENGSGQINFLKASAFNGSAKRSIQLSVEHMTYDVDWFYRTCLRLSNPPSIAQVSTSGKKWNLKWDEESKCVYIE